MICLVMDRLQKYEEAGFSSRLLQVALIILIVVSGAFPAYAERSYLMIPDATDRAERLSELAGQMPGKTEIHAPRTASEWMRQLHQIDADLERIILIAKRFQQASQLIERGIQDARSFALENRTFMTEWGPVLQGNYRLMTTAYEYNSPANMRMLVAIAILENLISTMPMRIASIHRSNNLQLKFTKQARVVAAARQRVHQHLFYVRKNIKVIRNTARAAM